MPLALGFDPGIDTAGFAVYDEERGAATLDTLNLRLTTKNGVVKNLRLSDTVMRDSARRLADMYSAELANAEVVGIEYPQRQHRFNIQALAFKQEVEARFPQATVRMVNPKERTAFFDSSAATYGKRKLASWDAMRMLVSDADYDKCRDTFQRRVSRMSKALKSAELVSQASNAKAKAKTTSRLVYKPDACEALELAIVAKHTPMRKLNEKAASATHAALPVDTVVRRTASVALCAPAIAALRDPSGASWQQYKARCAPVIAAKSRTRARAEGEKKSTKRAKADDEKKPRKRAKAATTT